MEPFPTSRALSNNILRDVLLNLHQNQCPYVPNPPGCPKRASVALILRIRPRSSNWPEEGNVLNTQKSISTEDSLNSFFEIPWVRQGDAEVLFIKRAARSGDRWTSHVALPGGKRDPGDLDDRYTAIRETSEEVGLNIGGHETIFVGNLPERTVTTSWGTIPLMVLCPFVFVYTSHALPLLNLQPNEVASAHWVPIRALLSPSLRTFEYCDVSDRLTRRGGVVVRVFLRAMLGQMMFAAVRLCPSESHYCSSTPEFLSEAPNHTAQSFMKRLFTEWWVGDHAGSASPTRPLLLWGLTLGILADFLDLIPPHSILRLWTWPTFTSPDVRFVLWVMTYRFRKEKRRLVDWEHLDALVGAQDTVEHFDNKKQSNSTTHNADVGSIRSHPRSVTVGVLIEGYFEFVRKGVAVTLLGRFLGLAAIVAYVIARIRNRQLKSSRSIKY